MYEKYKNKYGLDKLKYFQQIIYAITNTSKEASVIQFEVKKYISWILVIFSKCDVPLREHIYFVVVNKRVLKEKFNIDNFKNY